MNWKFDNGIHLLEFTTDDLDKMKKGGIHTIKTRKQELIVIKHVRG